MKPPTIKNLKYIIRYSYLFGICLISAISPCSSKNITLAHKNGKLTVHGKLINFDGKTYVVQSTNFGQMTVNSNSFKCISENCPIQAKQMRYSRKQGPHENIIFSGSNLIGSNLLPEIIKSYAQNIGANTKKLIGKNNQELDFHLNNIKNEKIASIHVQSHSSENSFKALMNGQTDIGMSSRPINKRELASMAKAGMIGMNYPGREHVLALDGILVILSPQNPINALSIEQISKIFSGKITNWKQVGGRAGKIKIYSKNKNTGTFESFKSYILKPYNNSLSKKVTFLKSEADLSDKVARDPNAIGFNGIANRRNAKAIAISSSCGIFIPPTQFNIKTEEYPLARRLYLYTSKKLKSRKAKKILKYALSDLAQNAVVKAGFIDHTIEALPFRQQADRLALALSSQHHDININMIKQYSQEFKDANRLSMTFRFRPSSVFLDNKSLADVNRLTRLIKNNKFRGKKIFLVGFADSQGSSEQNIILSLNRANSVKVALVAESGGKISPDALNIRAYGELMPVNCNQSKYGRHKNRRVEVWIK